MSANDSHVELQHDALDAAIICVLQHALNAYHLDSYQACSVAIQQLERTRCLSRGASPRARQPEVEQVALTARYGHFTRAGLRAAAMNHQNDETRWVEGWGQRLVQEVSRGLCIGSLDVRFITSSTLGTPSVSSRRNRSLCIVLFADQPNTVATFAGCLVHPRRLHSNIQDYAVTVAATCRVEASRWFDFLAHDFVQLFDEKDPLDSKLFDRLVQEKLAALDPAIENPTLSFAACLLGSHYNNQEFRPLLELVELQNSLKPTDRMAVLKDLRRQARLAFERQIQQRLVRIEKDEDEVTTRLKDLDKDLRLVAAQLRARVEVEEQRLIKELRDAQEEVRNAEGQLKQATRAQEKNRKMLSAKLEAIAIAKSCLKKQDSRTGRAFDEDFHSALLADVNLRDPSVLANFRKRLRSVKTAEQLEKAFEELHPHYKTRVFNFFKKYFDPHEGQGGI